MTEKTKNSVALEIAERAYARALIKQAVGAGPGLSSPAPWTGGSGAPKSLAPKAPSAAKGIAPAPNVAGAFASGMGQGVKNMAGGIGNFAVGAWNFAAPGAMGLLAQTSPHPDTRRMGREWLQQSLAGGRDAVESLGQYVGLNNAFDQNGQYVGAQSPQHLARHRQHIENKYFSNPKDADLLHFYRGSNTAADGAVKTIPGVVAGQAAVNAVGQIPAVARVGNAAKNMVESNKTVDGALRATSVATGMPLHPSALPGGSLSGAMGLSQTAQYYAPPIAALASGAVGAPAVAQTISDAQPYLPAIAADDVVRQIHPSAPEYIDYATNPDAAKNMPVMQALVDFAQPEQAATQPQQPDPPQVDPTSEPAQVAQEDAPAAASADQSSPAGFTLPEDTPPEVRAQVNAGAEQIKNMPEEKRQAAEIALTKPGSPEQKELVQAGAQNMVAEARNDPNNPPPADPQGYGQWVGGVMENFQKMDTPSQIAMGLGLGMGLLGLISSLGGEGGVGSFLMSALGLGAAGVMGAGAGMFGDQAQQAVGSGIRSLAGGMIPEGKQDLSLLTAQDPVAAAMNSAGVGDISGQLAKVDQLKQLTQLPSFLAVPLLRSLDPENIKTPEDAQRAYANAQRLQAEISNPESALARRIQLGRGAVDTYNTASQAVGDAGNYIKNLIGSWTG